MAPRYVYELFEGKGLIFSAFVRSRRLSRGANPAWTGQCPTPRQQPRCTYAPGSARDRRVMSHATLTGDREKLSKCDALHTPLLR